MAARPVDCGVAPEVLAERPQHFLHGRDHRILVFGVHPEEHPHLDRRVVCQGGGLQQNAPLPGPGPRLVDLGHEDVHAVPGAQVHGLPPHLQLGPLVVQVGHVRPPAGVHWRFLRRKPRIQLDADAPHVIALVERRTEILRPEQPSGRRQHGNQPEHAFRRTLPSRLHQSEILSVV